MKALTGLVLATGVGVAQAGALSECAAADAEPARVLRCVQLAHRAATDEMLQHFLGVEQAIKAAAAPWADRAQEALKQSQRAFERYLGEHCRALLVRLNTEQAAALACEADLLRQRAAALEALEALESPNRRP